VAEPVVTVIIAAYNERPYILDSVASVLAQTLPDLELIVVDDASTDGTGALLHNVSDPRLRLHTNPRNLGLTPSLNVALALARAPYVARLDAHDLCHPTRLQRQIDHLEANPGLALLGSSCLCLDHRGRSLSPIQVKTRAQGLLEALPGGNQFIHSSVVFRRRAALQLGGYREPFCYAQDYDLWLRLAERWPVDNLAQPLVTRRLVPSSISARRLSQQLAFARLARLLAAERRSCGREITSLQAESRRILALEASDFARAGHWLAAATLSLGARRYRHAALYLVRSFLADPTHPEVWSWPIQILSGKLSTLLRRRASRPPRHS
jgi:hypothetical protein